MDNAHGIIAGQKDDFTKELAAQARLQTGYNQYTARKNKKGLTSAEVVRESEFLVTCIQTLTGLIIKVCIVYCACIFSWLTVNND